MSSDNNRRRERKVPENRGTSQSEEKETIDTLGNDDREFVQELLKKQYKKEDLPEASKDILATDKRTLLKGLITFRKVLSKEDQPPIEDVINLNVCPKLLEIAKNNNEPYLQFESLWSLTNVASGTTQQTLYLAQIGAITVFLDQIGSIYSEISDQAIWAVANIAGDSSQLRDAILKLGAVDKFCEKWKSLKAKNQPTKEDFVWAISNLVRGNPLPEFQVVSPLAPILIEALKIETNEQKLIDALWGLSYMSQDQEDENMLKLLKEGALEPVVKHLASTSMAILTPSLRIVGNFASGEPEVSKAITENKEIIPKIVALIKHEKQTIRKEALWTLSNITAESGVQIEMVIHNEEDLKKIYEIAQTDSPQVAKEALYVIANVIQGGTPAQITKALNAGYWQLCDSALSSQDASILQVALEGLEGVLKHGEDMKNNQGLDTNPYVAKLEEQGMLDKLETLQEHPSNQVYQSVAQILENYFDIEG